MKALGEQLPHKLRLHACWVLEGRRSANCIRRAEINHDFKQAPDMGEAACLHTASWWGLWLLLAVVVSFYAPWIIGEAKVDIASKAAGCCPYVAADVHMLLLHPSGVPANGGFSNLRC